MLRNLEIDLENDVFIPIGYVNRLRRDAIARLDAETDDDRSGQGSLGGGSSFSHLMNSIEAPVLKRARGRGLESALSHFLVDAQPWRHASPQLITLCRTFDQIEVALEERIETIYVDFEDVRLYQKAVERIGGRAQRISCDPAHSEIRRTGVFPID